MSDGFLSTLLEGEMRDRAKEHLTTMTNQTQNPDHDPPQKILAISSGGGHWVQMNRVVPAFANCIVVFATVSQAYSTDVPGRKFYSVFDVTRWNRIRWLQTAFQILWIIIKERPDIIISTGALPGYMALRMGKFFGTRTIWLDSIANAETLSSSGERVKKYADLYLTQWPHLARADGPQYSGAVL